MKLLWDAIGTRVRRAPRALRDELCRQPRAHSGVPAAAGAGDGHAQRDGSVRRPVHGRLRRERLGSPGARRCSGHSWLHRPPAVVAAASGTSSPERRRSRRCDWVERCSILRWVAAAAPRPCNLLIGLRRRTRCGAGRSSGGGWRTLGAAVGPQLRGTPASAASSTSLAAGAAGPAPGASPLRRALAAPAPARVRRSSASLTGCTPPEPAMQRVVIIGSGSGNLHSAAKAFERAARESGADVGIVVSRTPEAVAGADRVVLPGVGAFAYCRAGLDAVPGMVAALEETVRLAGRPFLGICVGMQLMASRGLEKTVTSGLGWIPGDADLAPDRSRPQRFRTWAGTRSTFAALTRFSPVSHGRGRARRLFGALLPPCAGE